MMDVFDTLDALESHVRASPGIPFTRLRAVDRSVIDRLLQTIREQMERAAPAPVSEQARDEVLSQAENEGKLIVEAARQEAQEILRDERIKSLSQRQFDEIVSAGRQQADQLMRAAYAYTVERMTAIERSLTKLRAQVGEGLEVTRKTTQVAEKDLRQRQKEVARTRARERRRKIKAALF